MTPLDSAYQALLNGAKQMLVAQGSDPVLAARQAQGLAYGLLMRHASMLGFLDDFWLMAVATLVMIPFMFLMKKVRPHKEAETAY
jgi:DHA2 family multidrug resistance protein